jgi:hypothetical protein
LLFLRLSREEGTGEPFPGSDQPSSLSQAGILG